MLVDIHPRVRWLEPEGSSLTSPLVLPSTPFAETAQRGIRSFFVIPVQRGAIAPSLVELMLFHSALFVVSTTAASQLAYCLGTELQCLARALVVRSSVGRSQYYGPLSFLPRIAAFRPHSTL